MVVVALLLGTGLASVVPAVSNRLGLPWAPNLPQGPPPEPLALSPVLTGPAGSAAPAPGPSGVAAVLEGPTSDPALGTLGGSVVHPGTGTELWNHGAGQPLTPASTTKLLTAAAALLALDHDQRLSTTVVRGESPGTVVLVAGGDVTLSSLPEGERPLHPGAAHLAELVAQVEDATGGEVDEVRLDPGVYSGPATAPGWEPVDTPSTYAVEIDPAMLDGGRGDPTDRGSMGVADPSGELVDRLAGALGAEAGPPTSASDDAEVLGEVTSAPVVDLVRQALRESDNVLTEALARQVAIAEGEPASFAGSARAVRAVLEREGFDVSGVELSDGSGLSMRNRIPASTLTGVLSVAAAPDPQDPRTRTLRPMLGGLPVAGGSGTLADRYDGDDAGDGRGWVRAKTGTLDGVNALAGLVLDGDGRVLVFAFLSEGGRTDEARPALDAAAAALRGCGCT